MEILFLNYRLVEYETVLFEVFFCYFFEFVETSRTLKWRNRLNLYLLVLFLDEIDLAVK